MTFEQWYAHILLSCYSSQGLLTLKACKEKLREEYERLIAEEPRRYENRGA